MKIGDRIQRKDIPGVLFEIIGEDKKWNAWVASPVIKYPGFNKSKGLVDKNDDRWEVIKS